MNKNISVLENYKRRLSLYFACILLGVIWIIVGFFEASQGISGIIKENNQLKNKVLQIENIIENKQIYGSVEELTLKKIVRNILEDSIVKLNNREFINFIQEDISGVRLRNKEFSIIGKYKYYSSKYNEGKNEYTILVRKEINFSLQKTIFSILYILIFTLPFIVGFYLLGYFFVGKNFIPIKQTIENLEDFIGNVQHEFKTPLAEIISTLELSKKTQEYAQSVDTALASTKKINSLLTSLTSMLSFVDSNFKHQKVDIIEMADDILKTYTKKSNGKKIDISTSYSKKSLIKYINPEHFYICFSNILSNAIKYSKEDVANIEICIEDSFFSIKDYGVGIEEKNIDKIFSKHFRESYTSEGEGLGLAIVKKICDIEKWKITVSSKKNEFTEVKINF